MEKKSILLATVATVATFQLHGACCGVPSTCTIRPVVIPPVNPAVKPINEFFTGIAAPFEGERCPYVVVGGSGNYSTSSYPQFVLYDLFAAVLEDGTSFGGEEGFSRNSEKFNNYFWGAYGGFHLPLCHCWDIGVEVGYKKLVRTKSTTHILYRGVADNDFLLDGFGNTPFRTTTTNAWDLLVAVKYQTLMGFNLFVKAGGAKLNSVITEGNLIALNDRDFDDLNAFGTHRYSLVNIYPELEVGAGFRVLNHFEIHLSYAKIFAPDENDLISTSTLFFRPRKCPSIDLFTLSLELLLF